MVRMDEVFVMGRTILFVHIPDRINISQHLQQYVRLCTGGVEQEEELVLTHA